MYHFKFNELPKSLNKALRSSRWGNNDAHKSWHNLVLDQLTKMARVPTMKKARIVIIRHHYRSLDFDGCVGSMKPVIDALVSNGVIIDDSWNVTGAWDVDQVFRPKKLGPLLEIFVADAKE